MKKTIISLIALSMVMGTSMGINGFCIDEAEKNLAHEITIGQKDADFNCDGKTDWVDAVYILNYYSYLSTGLDIGVDSDFYYYFESQPQSVINKMDTYMLENYSYVVEELENGTAMYMFNLDIDEEIISKLKDNADINGDGHVDAEDTVSIAISYFLSYDNGDVNNDCILDASDASSILSYYASKSVGKRIDRYDDICIQTIGDINSDGIIDASDASGVLAVYAERATS